MCLHSSLQLLPVTLSISLVLPVLSQHCLECLLGRSAQHLQFQHVGTPGRPVQAVVAPWR